jgi:hypothetical protein
MKKEYTYEEWSEMFEDRIADLEFLFLKEPDITTEYYVYPVAYTAISLSTKSSYTDQTCYRLVSYDEEGKPIDFGGKKFHEKNIDANKELWLFRDINRKKFPCIIVENIFYVTPDHRVFVLDEDYFLKELEKLDCGRYLYKDNHIKIDFSMWDKYNEVSLKAQNLKKYLKGE